MSKAWFFCILVGACEPTTTTRRDLTPPAPDIAVQEDVPVQIAQTARDAPATAAARRASPTTRTYR